MKEILEAKQPRILYLGKVAFESLNKAIQKRALELGIVYDKTRSS